MEEKSLNTVNNDKILWINGLKGLACFMVFIHHYFTLFYPAMLSGKIEDSKTSGNIDVLFAYKPYNFFINGNFYVCIFVLITAFLYSRKIMSKKNDSIVKNFASMFIKRYLRLMLNIVVVFGLYYLLIWTLNICGKNIWKIDIPFNVTGFFKQALIIQWFSESKAIETVLWPMAVLLWGAMIAAFLSLFDKSGKWYMPLIYILIGYPLTLLYSYLFVVIAGVVIADIVIYKRVEYIKGKAFLGVISIALGLFLGGYPSGCEPRDEYYLILKKCVAFIYFRNTPAIILHCMGATLLIFGIVMLPKTRLLEGKVLGFLGNICFEVYLVHIIVLKLVISFLVSKIEIITGSNIISNIILLPVWTLIVILTAFFYKKIFSSNIEKLLKKL